ncbi:two component, sigma54 specific, transcriptional regulator, Fis family [Tindallia magadiensis]|uniref:Stage 0 sporulation protein A homolog n=1 Tax=Tindallia magadiensis TaxID=69895 RepID=A0A1I3CWW4_9FIRM|nr:sigma-54 dependent transcriptional regulator [Tindallia magadiensis]SFH79030.1 two component, sigma54 specific, transcriptional regulator, Fis family [Tindallia magadiensis]
MQRLLVIEDEEHLREVLIYLLEEEGYLVDGVKDGIEGENRILSMAYDLVITDIKLPGKDGLSLLELKEKHHLNTAFVLITSYGSVESAVEAIKMGAEEYVTKPFRNDDLIRIVNRIMKYRQMERENKVYRQALEEKYTFSENVIGKSKAMRNVFDIIEKVASYDASVLISGDSGTGKEMIARALHFNSPRHKHHFVPINCAAIPENLLESEFFGYAKGAFTGAVGEKTGLFQQAEGGTILLDEISEMSHSLQVKLLRVLQDKEVRKVGALETSVVDVRILAATNKQLKEEVEKGNFREDLYYRLNVVNIDLPSLQQRKEDIPLLTDHFIDKYNQRYQRRVKGVNREVMTALLQYSWPGNVRELEHVIESALTLCEGEWIDLRHIQDKIQIQNNEIDIMIPQEERNLKKTLEKAKIKIEKEMIRRALEETNQNRTEAARLLGISHRSLMYKISDYEI